MRGAQTRGALKCHADAIRYCDAGSVCETMQHEYRSEVEEPVALPALRAESGFIATVWRLEPGEASDPKPRPHPNSCIPNIR
jgi:hypothetical protein